MKKTKIIYSIAILIALMSLPQTSKAVLQSNIKTFEDFIEETPTYWMTNIRNMESENQAMGLKETIDSTTKKATSKSNNIDVHMIKTTEWGAMAILSASGYGNSEMIHNSEVKSTTGNKSGIYIQAPTCDMSMAGGLKNKIFSGVDRKYYDEYDTTIESAKTGDVLGNSTTANPRML